MPQIEKITYITTIYWVLISYFVVYLDLIVTYLYKFLTSLKFDSKRLSLILTRALRWNLEQLILRQWSKYPIAAGITIAQLLREDNKKHVNPYPRPPERDNFYDYLCDADGWVYHWAGSFSQEQWITSLLTGVFAVPILTVVYNWLALVLGYPGIWLKWWQRWLFYIFDLCLNVIFGPISLISRDSYLCLLVTSCPVVLSPVFLIMEFLLFIYHIKFANNVSDLSSPKEYETRKALCKELIKWLVDAIVLGCSLDLILFSPMVIGNKIEASTYIAVALISLMQASVGISFTIFKHYINTGQWEEVWERWKKKADKQDAIIVGKKHFVRKKPAYRKSDLERELARKPSFFEKIFLPFYKIFNIKTKREKQKIELEEIKQNKSTNNKKSLYVKFKSGVYEIFGKHYEKVRDPLVVWIAAKIFKEYLKKK